MGATLARSAAIGQQAIAISGPAARRGGPGAGRCAGGMGTQATHAHLHGIECVERLGLNPLMRALVWLLEWLPAKTAEWLTTRSESGWLRDQPLKNADLSPTVKTEFCEFSCMRAFCL